MRDLQRVGSARLRIRDAESTNHSAYAVYWRDWTPSDSDCNRLTTPLPLSPRDLPSSPLAILPIAIDVTATVLSRLPQWAISQQPNYVFSAASDAGVSFGSSASRYRRRGARRRCDGIGR